MTAINLSIKILILFVKAIAITASIYGQKAGLEASMKGRMHRRTCLNYGHRMVM